MARYRDAKCKLCRREGMKLFLKGDRCVSTKCGVDRRQYAPGEHGQRLRSRTTEYGLQLREKQKVKRIYGVLEGQFRNYFERAERRKGVTGENLLRLLEARLDNVVYRFGFAPSRASARQLVLHGHFSVDGRKVDRPSYQVKPGQRVSVREKSRGLKVVKESLQARGADQLPWLSLDEASMSGTFLEEPTREAIPLPVQEQLIVELYSK